MKWSITTTPINNNITSIITMLQKSIGPFQETDIRCKECISNVCIDIYVRIHILCRNIYIHLHIYQSCHVHNVYAVLNYIHSTMLHDNSSPPHPTSSPPSPVPHLHWKSTPRGYLAQGFDVKAGTWLGGSKNALWANQLGHEKHHHKLWDSESTIQLKQLTRQYFVHQQWISPTCNRNHLPYLHFLRSWNGPVHHLLWTNVISMFDLDSHFFSLQKLRAVYRWHQKSMARIVCFPRFIPI